MTRLIDAWKLCEYANNLKDKCVDANDIMRFPAEDAVPVQDGILKARKGDYVTYRIDYLLDHLAQEISLLEGYRRGRKEE